MAGGASRIFGLGILVSAKDDGAKRTIHDVREETDSLADSTKAAGESTAVLGSKWDTFVQGLQLHRLNQMSESLAGMARQAGTALPGLMSGAAFESTGIESAGVAFSNTWRSMTAGMGEFKENIPRGEIAGLAYGLDVSADSMIGANVALARAGHTLDDYNFSQRALAGLIKAGIVDGPAFGQTLVSAADGYGLGAERAGAMMNQVMALGEATGDAAGAMGALPAVMQALDVAGAEFPEVAANMDTYATSIIRLGATMQQAGLGAMAETSASATQVFTTLMGSRRNLTNLFTGVGSDFDGLATEIGIATGDIGGAVDLVMQDPFRFARALNEMTNKGGQSAQMAQRLRGKLVEVAPNLAFLADGGEEAAEVFERMGHATDDAGNAINRVGESAAHTSRTLAESMGRQEDAFKSRLNRMSRDAVGGSGSILQQQRDSYSAITDTITRFADDSGPMGMLTRGFLKSRAGLFGFTSALDAVGGPVLDMAAQLAPLVSTLSMMGGPIAAGLLRFNGALGGMPGKLIAALGPIALVAGAGYLIYKNWDRLGELFDSGMDSLFNFSNKLPGMGKKLMEWVAGIDWVKMGMEVTDGILGAFSGAGDAVEGDTSRAREIAQNFGHFFKAVFEAVPRMVGGFISGAWDRIVAFVTEPEDLMGKLKRGAGVLAGVFTVGLFTPLRGLIFTGAKNAFMGLFGRLGGLLTGGAGLTGAGLMTAARRLPVVGALIGVLFELPNIIEDIGKGDYSAAIQGLWTSMADGLLLGIPSLLDSLLGTDVFGNALDFLFRATNFGRLADAIASGNIGDAIFEGLFTVMNTAMMGIPGMVRTFFEDMGLGDLFDGMKETAGLAFEDITFFFVDMFGDMYGSAEETFLSVYDFIDGFIESSKPLIKSLGAMFSRIWEGMKKIFKRVMDFIAPVARRVFAAIGGYFTWLWENIWQPVLGAFRDNFMAVMGFIRENFGTAIMFLGKVFITVFEQISMDIDLFGIRWEALKTIVVAGAEYIGLSIRNFFVNPFLRAQNSVSTFIEIFTGGFARIKAGILDLKADLMGLLADTLDAMPGDLFADQVTSLRASQSRAATAAEKTRRDTAASELISERERARRLGLAQENEAEAAARMDLINSTRGTVGMAEATRAAQRDRNVAATLSDLGEATTGGDVAQAVGAEERRIAREDRGVDAAAVVEELADMPEATETAPAAARRRRSGTQVSSEPTTAQQREVAQRVMERRTELQEEARTAREQQTAEVKDRAIASFGPTAIAQLADAMTIRIPRAAMTGSPPGG
jgi:hypothetical protein